MTQLDAYARAGVNIAAGNRATELMKAAVRTTYGPEVLSDTGSFGGLYNASAIKTMDTPVLVASTDGVGTKTKVASQLNKWDTIGQDIVNHCVNDILVQGARPLFFLDYVATAKLDPEQIATIVAGVAHACKEIGCALIGGETAEMPSVYEPGEIDLAGTVVGVVEREKIIDGSQIQPGNIILGLSSTGLHTNGYTLARKVLADLDWNVVHPELGITTGEALLAIHRCYLKPINKLWDAGVNINGLAHITGSGTIENLPRILPDGVKAVIQRGSWIEPPIFGLIQRIGSINEREMFLAFNMGLGMLVILSPEQVAIAQSALPGELSIVGKITVGDREVEIRS